MIVIVNNNSCLHFLKAKKIFNDDNVEIVRTKQDLFLM